MIPWSLSLSTAPNAKPLPQPRVLNHCRIELPQPGCDSDTVNGWIDQATEQAETFTGRQLITATFELRMARFPCGHIVLPKPPCASVTHIKYYAPGENTLATWASSNYHLDAPSGPKAQNARIFLAANASYPSTDCRPDAVIVTFVCGYGPSDANVPESIKGGMLLRIGAINEKREDSAQETKASERLWSGFVTYMPEMR